MRNLNIKQSGHLFVLVDASHVYELSKDADSPD